MQKKIAIVDDELDIRKGLANYLHQNHYLVDDFEGGLSFLTSFSKKFYDLIILDVMMPEMDGLEICREIRKNSQVPVIFLSSAGESFDRILGIETGADDYITKPFTPREVLARIKSILRRSESKPLITSKISTPHWEIDTHQQKIIYKNGEEVSFTPALYKLFNYLYKSKSYTVTREKIFEDILKRAFEEFDRTIDIRISRLRKLLDTCPDQDTSYIQTIKGTGYRLDLYDECIPS
ncbi:response regulator transcription factor [Francisella sciaenopsi]|uniref:Response regulator n=1 Tax=Francisella sciaenopsi TaxID=3055034 RepID=A0ABQ6PEB9_9GAMM